MARLTSTRTRFWQAARMGSKSALRGAAPLAGLPNTRTLGSAATIDLLAGESQGLAIDFTYPTGLGTVQVLDTTTPANCLNFVPADSFLTQSGTSPKLVLWSDGLYRWTGHNLLIRSEAIGTAVTWADLSAGTTTVVATNIASPTGSLNAVQLIGNNVNTYWGQTPVVIDATYTAAIWLRADAPVSITLRLSIGGATDTTANLTTAWQQFTVTRTAPAAGSMQVMFNIGNGVNIYAWGAQLNRGTVPTAYHVTLASAWYGVPIEYDPTTGKFYALVEPQATNLALYASDFTNAAWVKSNMTTALTATGPDGVANSASTLTATAGNATALQAITSGSASRVTSMFVKRRTGSGVVNLTQDNGGTWTAVTVTAGWTNVPLAAVTSANPTVGIRIVTSGDAVDVAWFQHELTAVTSPIPTFAVTVTRGVDTISALATTFPLSATAGSVIWEGVAYDTGLGGSRGLWELETDGNNLFGEILNDGPLLFGVTNGGVSQANINSGTPSANATFKTGSAWALNDFSQVRSGGAAGTDTSGTLPAVTTLYLGRSNPGGVLPLRGRISKFTYLPRRVSDADLITRTAP